MSRSSDHTVAADGPKAPCPACEKPAGLCVCAAIAPLDNRIEVIVLRHPQEQDRDLGTARILTMQLRASALKTGLSWANLAKVVGRPADPKRWGVLYLGTIKNSAAGRDRALTAVDAKGLTLPDQDTILGAIEGLILLDGNWAQAKALWWRNPWMLKCRRLLLSPRRPSLYGDLRREPRAQSLSTIEAAALALAELEGEPSLPEHVLAPFRLLLNKARQSAAAGPSATGKRWTS